MRWFSYILVFFGLSLSVEAQTKNDSVSVSRIDAIVNKINTDIGLIKKIIPDSLNKRRTVTGFFKNEQLVVIHYYDNLDTGLFLFRGCTPNTTYFLQNDSLIYVKYAVFEPDRKNSQPASQVNTFYFDNDKLINSDFYAFGIMPCIPNWTSSKQFVDECNRLKKLLYEK